jgi:hypothetical protein
MCCFIDVSNKLSVKVHRNGLCIVENRSHDLKEIDDAFFEALWLDENGPLKAEEALCVVASLRPKSMHRVFPVGAFLPSFKCNSYKQSLGLTVTADKSHPGFLEIHEDWPVWVQLTLEHIQAHTKIDFDQRSQDREIVHNLAEQIRAHLYAVESIGKAAEGLRQSVAYLPENVGKAVEDGVVRAVSSFLMEGLGKEYAAFKERRKRSCNSRAS